MSLTYTFLPSSLHSYPSASLSSPLIPSPSYPPPLIPRDCVCVTDYGIKGLAERCRSIEHLILKGCDKITDKGLLSMSQTKMERTTHKYPMCDTFKILDLSFCFSLSVGCLSKVLFPLCPNLQEVHLSGIVAIDDVFIQLLCQSCPSVQILSLQVRVRGGEGRSCCVCLLIRLLCYLFVCFLIVILFFVFIIFSTIYNVDIIINKTKKHFHTLIPSLSPLSPSSITS